MADYSVRFTVDGAGQHGRESGLYCRVMALCGGTDPIASWADSEQQSIENHIADIAVAIVVHGERVCRASAEHYRAYVIKRKGEILAEERRKEAERQRLERERLKRLEEARIARLLAQANALWQAEEIRTYVAAVQARQSTIAHPLSEAELNEWTTWSLHQADRLDPIVNATFAVIHRDGVEQD